MPIDTGINAGLGASNYSPFLQGAMQGAQMQAQGAQAIGQGLSNLGSSAGQTFVNIGEQKKQNQQLEGSIKGVESFLKSSKSTAEEVSPGMGDKIDAILAQINDPKLSLEQRASIAANTQQHFGEVLGLGIQAKQLKDNAIIAKTMQGGLANAIQNGATFEQLNAQNTGTPTSGRDAYQRLLQAGIPADKAAQVASTYGNLTKEDIITASLPEINKLNFLKANAEFQKILADTNLANVKATTGLPLNAAQLAQKAKTEAETAAVKNALTEEQLRQQNVEAQFESGTQSALSVAQDIKGLLQKGAGGKFGYLISSTGMGPLAKDTQELTAKINQFKTVMGENEINKLRQLTKGGSGGGTRISPAVLDTLAGSVGSLRPDFKPEVNLDTINDIISSLNKTIQENQKNRTVPAKFRQTGTLKDGTRVYRESPNGPIIPVK
jgi:hypothetical protein